MKRLLVVLLVIWPVAAEAQAIRRPQPIDTCAECPALDSISCQLWPEACAACWESCGEQPGEPPRRATSGRPYPLDPYLKSYHLDRSIGVTQIAYELYPANKNRYQTTSIDVLRETWSHGFRSIKLWTAWNPFEGMGQWCWSTYYGKEICAEYSVIETRMRELWETAPPGATIFLRPFDIAWSWIDEDGFASMALADYYAIAKRLYSEFGDRDITVVLTDWEQDWIINAGYQEFLLRIIQQRQSDLQRARKEAYLERRHSPVLRVMHAVIVNRYPANSVDYDKPLLAELIPSLDIKPDLIGVSFWHNSDPVETLDWIRDTTGYPSYRIYIDEYGGFEDQQVERFSKIVDMFEWGVDCVNIWLWKQAWMGDGIHANRGLWKQVGVVDGEFVWGDPTDGYYVLQDILDGIN